MADIQSDEQTPFRQMQSDSNIASDNEAEAEEEEEKTAIFPQSYQNEPYQAELSPNSETSSSNKSEPQQDDISNSSFLLCRITIFLYALVSILVIKYFPNPDRSHINAAWESWFKLFISVNIIACIIGMGGAYVNKTQLLFVCWVLCTVSICLTAFLLLAYIFNKENGVEYEATSRCHEWMAGDERFPKKYTLEQCLDNMKTQLLWTVIGLYVIYSLAAGFGIHIIRNTQISLQKCVMINQPATTDSNDDTQSDISNLSGYQELIDPHNEFDIELKHKKK